LQFEMLRRSSLRLKASLPHYRPAPRRSNISTRY
jgi:hypothetical protein